MAKPGISRNRAALFFITLATIITLTGSGTSALAQTSATSPKAAQGKSATTAPPSAGSAKLVGPAQPAPSNAQKIAELRSQIETEQKQLEKLKQELADQANPDNDFTKAEQAFKKLDVLWKEAKQKVADLKSDDQVDEEQVAAAEHQVEVVEAKRKEALSAYEIEIEENKTLQEKILTIQKKVDADQATLERLTKPADTAKTPKAHEALTKTEAETPGKASAKEKPATKTDKAVAVAEKKAEAAKQESESKSAASAVMASTPMGMMAAAATGGAPIKTEKDAQGKPTSTLAKRVKNEIAGLADSLLELQDQLQNAKQDEALAAEQVTNLDQQVKLEEKLRDNARKKADMANETLSKAQEEFRVKSINDAPQDELKQLADKLLDLDKEFQTARNESRLHSNRLADIQTERAKQQEALHQAHDKTGQIQKQIEETEAQIAKLEDPTSLINVVDWLATRGVRILMILIIMVGSRATIRSLGIRAIRMMVQGQDNISQDERNDRAETLVSVYSNAVSVSVIGGGLLLIAQEAGVPIGPLLGGAAIFGLAVAFGAQSLIKDYFYGFVILLENQFSVNDVIQVGTTTGVVERITLRMTVLRDVAGTVHFIPNGSMTMVSNYSYDWSRAVFEIPVSYKAQVDDVIQEIMIEGKKFRTDKEFGSLCMDDLTMLGVDHLGENSVMIKFYIKTKPLKQWPVKRELLRRLKNRFDQKGIELQPSTKSSPAMIRADTPNNASNHGPNLNRAHHEALSELHNAE